MQKLFPPFPSGYISIISRVNSPFGVILSKSFVLTMFFPSGDTLKHLLPNDSFSGIWPIFPSGVILTDDQSTSMSM